MALIVLQGLNVMGGGMAQTAQTASMAGIEQGHVPALPASGNFYGSNHAWMLTATNDWYQHQDNWCGVASIRTIQVYDWLYYDGGAPKWDNSQEAIWGQLNGHTSPWGAGGGYVKANISRDFGTDPYAVAYGAQYETPPSSLSEPYWFHNWIYRTSAAAATYDFAGDFGAATVTHNDPITVMTDGGYHSFVIGGVYATSDPSRGGESISGIDTWDPWVNHANQGRNGHLYYNTTEEEVWSLADWITVPMLWGQAYNTNNGSDPDPDTPNHYYVPPFPGGYADHWGTYYVTIEQDRINTEYTPADYAIDQNGYIAPHN